MKIRTHETMLQMLVVSSSESDQEIKLIEIQYEMMVLNMVYQIPEGIRDCPILTGHMSSLNLKGRHHYLSIDGTIFNLDFK